jgi:hypothetical protein
MNQIPENAWSGDCGVAFQEVQPHLDRLAGSCRANFTCFGVPFFDCPTKLLGPDRNRDTTARWKIVCVDSRSGFMVPLEHIEATWKTNISRKQKLGAGSCVLYAVWVIVAAAFGGAGNERILVFGIIVGVIYISFVLYHLPVRLRPANQEIIIFPEGLAKRLARDANKQRYQQILLILVSKFAGIAGGVAGEAVAGQIGEKMGEIAVEKFSDVAGDWYIERRR